MILKLQEMTKDREDKMNALWSEFQQMLRNYSESTEEKYTEYVEMRDRDNADTKEIHQHYLEIAKATRDISLLKSVLEAQTNEHQIHMNQLNQYQGLLKEKQKRLKTAMNASEKTHKKMMKTLVISSTDVEAVSVDINVTINKRILNIFLNEICRNLTNYWQKARIFCI